MDRPLLDCIVSGVILAGGLIFIFWAVLLNSARAEAQRVERSLRVWISGGHEMNVKRLHASPPYMGAQVAGSAAQKANGGSR